MSLKSDYEAIIEQYGNDALLIHTDRSLSCTCYDPLTGSTDRKCKFCFGLGTIPVIEKHKIRERGLSVPDSLPFLSNSQLFGEMAVGGRAYYFKMDARVSEHDLILDVDWKGNKPVYTGRGLYEVSHIDAKRFENGEFVFQKVYVKDKPVLKEIRAIKIMEVAGKQLYQIEGGLR